MLNAARSRSVRLRKRKGFISFRQSSGSAKNVFSFLPFAFAAKSGTRVNHGNYDGKRHTIYRSYVCVKLPMICDVVGVWRILLLILNAIFESRPRYAGHGRRLDHIYLHFLWSEAISQYPFYNINCWFSKNPNDNYGENANM